MRVYSENHPRHRFPTGNPHLEKLAFKYFDLLPPSIQLALCEYSIDDAASFHLPCSSCVTVCLYVSILLLVPDLELSVFTFRTQNTRYVLTELPCPDSVLPLIVTKTQWHIFSLLISSELRQWTNLLVHFLIGWRLIGWIINKVTQADQKARLPLGASMF